MVQWSGLRNSYISRHLPQTKGIKTFQIQNFYTTPNKCFTKIAVMITPSLGLVRIPV